jgi:hypothetical protein
MATKYRVANGNWDATDSWAESSGGTDYTTVPASTDDVIFDANTPTGTHTLNVVSEFRDIDFTGFTGTFTQSADYTVHGNFTLSAGMTFQGFRNPTFAGTGEHTITMAGKFFITGTVTFSGTYNLNDAFSANQGLISITTGTLNTNSQNVSATAVSVSSTGTISLGSSTITLDGNYNSTVWSAHVDSAVNSGTSTITIENGGSGTFTFSGGGKTYNTVEYSGSGTGQLTIGGSNTFNTLQSTKSVAHTFAFTAGTTQTVENWEIQGTESNLVTITSTTTGTHNLVKTGGGKIILDYLNIQHSVATPSLTWYAGLNSVNNQNTSTAGSGWIFNLPVPDVSTLAVYNTLAISTWGSGEVTENYVLDVIRRGFVVSTTSRANPGDVSPEASAYEIVSTEPVTFQTGQFDSKIIGLTGTTTYYARAFAENNAGFSYGDEISFTTTTGVSDQTNVVASSVVNLQTTPTGIINQLLTPRVSDSLWLSSTLPWGLDEPWEYENDITYNTPVTNQTI